MLPNWQFLGPLLAFDISKFWNFPRLLFFVWKNASDLQRNWPTSEKRLRRYILQSKKSSKFRAFFQFFYFSCQSELRPQKWIITIKKCNYLSWNEMTLVFFIDRSFCTLPNFLKIWQYCKKAVKIFDFQNRQVLCDISNSLFLLLTKNNRWKQKLGPICVLKDRKYALTTWKSLWYPIFTPLRARVGPNSLFLCVI